MRGFLNLLETARNPTFIDNPLVCFAYTPILFCGKRFRFCQQNIYTIAELCNKELRTNPLENNYPNY